MKINEIIRKYRKQGNLTQEQIANYLGVTAPAVNKWENGISYPDITLLAPLARILKIDVDTLLSFNEELTEEEINRLLKEVSDMVKKEGYEKAFERGEELMKEYAKCDSMTLSLAQILNAFLTINDVKERDRYEEKILQWYELIADSNNQEVASMAIASLVSKYTEKKEYEKAQQLLNRIPPLGYDKQIMQAVLFTSQKKNEAAYEIYEQMLYKNVNEICSVIQLMLRVLSKEGEYDKAERYAAIGKEVAKLFDLGAYIENIPELFLAMEKKEIKRSLDTLEKMISGVNTMSGFTESDLYSHMKFHKSSDLEMVRIMLKKALESDKELDFLKDEPRFKSIVRALS
ncbi:putative transcriptional regulator [Mobilisporobacter senegalensis]|uniref:Putative transcriptional regulator n=1 Tax=Mobilisporobacter senegalensis TaxID=1329262 RepID=A0A3N1XAZ9_9FIRM|nr:helix-turn-helix transcriptional regulator [Mobilisporobacter senegalensis]ROR23940.1 putative transcriptional regulator [Mobilisporobacter senegalensis]